jgi:hypothetical protein
MLIDQVHDIVGLYMAPREQALIRCVDEILAAIARCAVLTLATRALYL